jgi:hypothetical protein
MDREPPQTGQHSAKRLRALLRASPLVPAELRAHWLRVLPHLTDEQRAELALLLEMGDSAPPSPRDAARSADPTSRG